jgi:hypothetical protein
MNGLPQFTVDDLRSGSPHSGWDEEIEAAARAPADAWRLRQGGTPQFYRSDEARAEWIEGAWAAVRGERDPTPNDCEWRSGYDWAARRALDTCGWEAWHLAWREVEERRPIGRSHRYGVRYYGRDHADVPPDISSLRTIDVALWKALHGMQGAVLRWEIYRQIGVTDADLALAISREFGTVVSGDVAGVNFYAQGCKLFGGTGNKHSRLIFGRDANEQKVTGPEIAVRARRLLALPVATGAPPARAPESCASDPVQAASPTLAPASLASDRVPRELTLAPSSHGGAEQLALF